MIRQSASHHRGRQCELTIGGCKAVILRQNGFFVCAIGGGRNWSSRLGGEVGTERILLAKPFFNLFSLGGQNDALPFHRTRLLVILSHNVQALVENLNEIAVRCSSELVRRDIDVVFLHVLLG